MIYYDVGMEDIYLFSKDNENISLTSDTTEYLHFSFSFPMKTIITVQLYFHHNIQVS